MNNTVNSNYAVRQAALSSAQSAAAQSQSVQGASFLSLLSQSSAMAGSLSGAASSGMGLSMDMSVLYRALGSLSAQAECTSAAQGVCRTQATGLEGMLKAKYPGLVYHVMDQSSSCWRTRSDYPHYLLYQQGEAAEEKLKNWQPTGENPPYGSVDGRFTAPPEFWALSSVPPGSKAVAIHPAVQQRMQQDPAYAQEIFARIDAWFTFDVARNEALLPGCTTGMSQSVAIGEDGSIVNVQSSSAPRLTAGSSDDDGSERLYRQRRRRTAEWMELRVQAQLEHAREYSAYLTASGLAAADRRAALAEMLRGGSLRQVLGQTIGGMATSRLLELTAEEIGMAL